MHDAPDPRIADGMRAQLGERRERLAAGERPLGWKVGFGSPESFELLSTDRPLVGFLTDRTLLEPGATVAIADWTAPVLEAEIAVRIGRSGSIAAIAPAIELADIDRPPRDVREILSGNIFHRHVLVGPFAVHEPSAVTARVLRDDVEVAATADPAAATGDVTAVVQLTAELLNACGESLRAGELVITGAVVPPIPIVPGERYRVELTPLAPLEISFAGER
jgi:2-keto-4-pentenoate hydratase